MRLNKAPPNLKDRILRFILLALLLITTPALAEPPKVLTDIAPVHSLVAQVMGDIGGPQILLTENADPHHAQLRPSQARALSNTDLLIWVGPDLTPWLSKPIKAVSEHAVILELNTTLPAANPHDPHTWLNPDNAAIWLTQITTKLIEIDPENAATYRANSVSATTAITELSAELATRLQQSQSKPLITGHDAYDHLAQAFQLNFTDALQDHHGTAPSAARLKSIRTKIQDKQISCGFIDADQSPDVFNAVQTTPPIAIETLDIIGSSLPLGPKLYSTLMRDLAETIAACPAK